jgi:hypothetical protein
MGLDWILEDASGDCLDTFRGKGICRLAALPSEIKDACYGDDAVLTDELRTKILECLRKLVESENLKDFLYEDEDDSISEKEMLKTKDFIGQAITFLESCYPDMIINCWY